MIMYFSCKYLHNVIIYGIAQYSYSDDDVNQSGQPPMPALVVGATESNSSLTVYAFRHPTTGRVTIVGRNIGGSSITLNGSLSSVGSVGALQFYQTSISNNYNSFTRGSDAVVTGGSFIVTVPANSYFTLTSQ